ncbi:MAG: energy transducer TonB [Cyclobacteriaceae bacterium]
MLVTKEKPEKTNVGMVCKPIDERAEATLSKNARVRLIGDLIELKNKRTESSHQQAKLFFFIGLTISLLFTILAFEWKTYDHNEIVDLGIIANDFEEILEIPPTEQAPPPPPQKIIAPVIKEVSNEEVIEEIELEIDVEVTEDMVIEEVSNFDFSADTPEEKVDEIFDIVETQPAPVGGFEAFYGYIKDNLRYPDRAARLDISGRVFVQFVVEKDGSITDVKVIKGLFEDCDEEAVRVIENAPAWNPGKQRGNPVRVYQRVPIMFMLKRRD